MPDPDVLTKEVKDFVLDRIATPVHLETLIMLCREPDREWTVAELARAQYTDADRVVGALEDFSTGRRLVRAEPGPAGQSYRFWPQDEALRETVASLLDAYNRMPVQLVRAVYDRPPVPIRSFADAFRIQRPK